MKTNEDMEKILIKALQQRIMSFSDMVSELKIDYNLHSAEMLSGLLTEIKTKEHLIEKLPGQYYIYQKRRK